MNDTVIVFPQRKRVDVPGDTPVIDVAREAAAAGCGLVHKGGEVYWTPRRVPGEFPVGARAA